MKSVIVDWSNLCMSKLFNKEVAIKSGKSCYEFESIEYDIFEYKIVESLWYFYKKYPNIREFIIAVDSKKYWRKLIYPKYKAHRQKTRNKFVGLDWGEYHKKKDDLLDNIKQYLPFKVVEVYQCECDDIVGTIVLNNKKNNYYIFSSDNDFLQLCSNKVKIYSLMRQEEIKHPHPSEFLKGIIIKGQQKDNIYNILTPTDYPEELRKPALGDKKLEKILISGLNDYLQKKVSYKKKFIDKNNNPVIYSKQINLLNRFNENTLLMDLSKTPEPLKRIILKKYDEYKYPDPSKIYKFFEQKNWKWFLENFTMIENSLMNLYHSN